MNGLEEFGTWALATLAGVGILALLYTSSVGLKTIERERAAGRQYLKITEDVEKANL